MPLQPFSEALANASAEGPATELNLDGKVSFKASSGDSLKDLAPYTSLRNLSLAGCGIRTDTLAEFPSLPALTTLSLSDNHVVSGLDALWNCPNLVDLDLSGNRISQLSVLSPLTSLHLTSLDLEGCPLDASAPEQRDSIFKMLATMTYLNGEDRLGKEKPADDDGGSEEEEEEEEYQEEEEEEEGDDDEEPAEGGEGGSPGGGGGAAGGDGDDEGEEAAEEDPEDAGEEEEEEEQEQEPGTAALAQVEPLSDDEEEYVEEEEEEEDSEEDEDAPAAKRTRKAPAHAADYDEEEEEEEEEDDDDDDDSDYDADD